MFTPGVQFLEAITAEINRNDVNLEFQFTVLENPSTDPFIIHWEAGIRLMGTGPTFFFKYRCGRPHLRDGRPDPVHLLGILASSVTMSDEMGPDKFLAIDWLLEEGYAAFVNDAWQMWHAITDKTRALVDMLAGTGVTAKDLATWADEQWECRRTGRRPSLTRAEPALEIA